MPTYSGGAGGSPIINVQAPPPPPPKPPYEAFGMIGMLALQFCLLSLIAWKLLSPPEAASSPALFAKLEKLIEARDETARLAEQQKRDLVVMDRVLAEAKGMQPGYVEAMRREMERNDGLQQDLANSKRAQRLVELETAEKLAELEENAESQSLLLKKVESEVADLTKERTKLIDDLAARDTEIKQLKEQLSPEKTTEAIFAWPPTRRTYILLGGLAVAGVILGVGVSLRFQGNGAGGESLSEPPVGGTLDTAARETTAQEPTTVRDMPTPTDEPETTPR